MTSCAGCNETLGWKKYRFQKQWRIQGYFCKKCMEKVGRDFDEHGKVTQPKRMCDYCNQEFYFLDSVTVNKKLKRCCTICKNLDPAEAENRNLPQVPPRIPIMMGMFAAFGIALMLAGFIYVVMVAPQSDSGLLHIILGSTMSGAGFMLARKMIKVRNLVLGKTPKVATELAN
ncbi:MAG: hypothetical protein ACW9WZ_02515 [Nitrosopumilus sp.]|jgi:hypothetical protein